MREYNYNYAAIISNLETMKHRSYRSILEFADPKTKGAVEKFFFSCRRYESLLDEAPSSSERRTTDCGTNTALHSQHV